MLQSPRYRGIHMGLRLRLLVAKREIKWVFWRGEQCSTIIFQVCILSACQSAFLTRLQCCIFHSSRWPRVFHPVFAVLRAASIAHTANDSLSPNDHPHARDGRADSAQPR